MYIVYLYKTVYTAYKRFFFNRETITALNYAIHLISFMPSDLPFYAAEIINPFLNSRIFANHDKAEILSANSEILIKGIVSLL